MQLSTMIGGQMLGRISLKMMNRRLSPRTCAASTNCTCRKPRVALRTTRATLGTNTMPMEITAFTSFAPSAATTSMASSSPGKDIAMSVQRIRISSTHPPV